MLQDKAVQNLAAGELLLERGLVDAAASRFYYAMYQAAVHALTERGLTPAKIRSGAIDWDHSMVENDAGLLRRRWEDRDLYRTMRKLRVKGDYRAAGISVAEVSPHRAAVADFVTELVR